MCGIRGCRTPGMGSRELVRVVVAWRILHAVVRIGVLHGHISIAVVVQGP